MNCYHFNYRQAINALNERLIVLGNNDFKVIWLSEKFSQAFPDISTESHIDDVINSIEIRKDSIDYFKSIITGKRNAEISRTRIQSDYYDVEVCSIDNNYSIVRLHDSTLVDEANGRYLEDREKLIFTAGSITVSEMASTIAHEINQPVGTINNLLQGIRDRLLSDSRNDPMIIQAIDKSMEQTKYTADIICRIRDYTHSRQPKIEEIDLKHLIDKCISLLDWEVRHTDVKITHEKFVKNAMVCGDELMLQQVIVNLIRNGIESMIDDDNTIIINTTKDDNYLKITIEDNGQGISTDELNSVFMPFSSRKINGMGIGLNICRSFIEMHRGKIWLTQNEGRGCTSHILLPSHIQGST